VLSYYFKSYSRHTGNHAEQVIQPIGNIKRSRQKCITVFDRSESEKDYRKAPVKNGSQLVATPFGFQFNNELISI
jgi:hypothetical protein